MDRPLGPEHPNQRVRMLDVDDSDVAYSAWYSTDGETMIGDATVVGRVSSVRAEAIRRSARAWREASRTSFDRRPRGEGRT